jgi:hypothetical protein
MVFEVWKNIPKNDLRPLNFWVDNQFSLFFKNSQVAPGLLIGLLHPATWRSPLGAPA